jgi:hypothetical protein
MSCKIRMCFFESVESQKDFIDWQISSVSYDLCLLLCVDLFLSVSAWNLIAQEKFEVNEKG